MVRLAAPVALLALLVAVHFGASARADVDTAPLSWSAKPDHGACNTTENAVWTNYRNGQDCIRFFPAGDLQDAPVVIVLMYGDRVNWLKRKAKDIPGNTAIEQTRRATRLANAAGVPVILLARPGTFGSSGNHRKRRQPSEFLALNAALDGIQEQYHIKHLVLLGHSGGATAGAALLTLGRRDVSCAVLTSGAYGLLERARMLSVAAGRTPKSGRDTTGLASPYDPLEHVGGIVRDPARTIILIGNPKDRVTPFSLQRRFAEALQEEGHSVRLMTHDAAAPDYHNLRGGVGLRTAADCAAGRLP